MSEIIDTIDYVKELAQEFGASIEDDLNKDYTFRNNTKDDALKNGGAFFGLISPDEDPSGPYHDFSYVIFPDSDNDSWLVSLVVGSLGFKNDFEIAGLPGIRRLFTSITTSDGFCKSSFLDIESGLPKAFRDKVPNLKKTISTYSKVMMANEIIKEPSSGKGKKIIAGYLAAYAKIRNWASNSKQKKAVKNALDDLTVLKEVDDEKVLLELVKNRRFVIIQGSPGTGKTRLAKIIAEKLNPKGSHFFTQFHAETDYSDFIYGIIPKLEKSQVGYQPKKGIFYQSLKHAIKNPKTNVVLIIDEINRANLSNILGPIFYLFEYKMEDTDVEISIGGNFKVRKIPDNFYVIATMNTADRSLAVVDFALRRRFAWYNLKPKVVKSNKPKFYKNYFSEIDHIFQWYGSSEELNLQPGQAYFFADSDEEMDDRIRYEILPLIREYLEEGLLLSAREEFSKFFIDSIEEELFE